MTLATKAELRADVGNWLSRTGEADFLARFDSFLALAEADFGTRLRARQLERRLRANLNEKWEFLPERTNQVRSVAILTEDDASTYEVPFYTYREAVKVFGPNSVGDIRAYTVVGDQIGFFPMAREDLTATRRFEVVIYQRPPPLAADLDTNVILTTYPGIYLYGTLLQSAPYYGREEDLLRWTNSYEAEIAKANGESSTTPGDVLIVRAG